MSQNNNIVNNMEAEKLNQLKTTLSEIDDRFSALRSYL
jgi:hypothetical protein